MRDKPVALDGDQRTIVGAAIQERSARRGWHVLAFNVRTNHVHVVVSSEADPKSVLNELNIAGTMALRAAGKAMPESRIWARGGSARPVKGRRALDAVVDYVLNRQ